MRTPHEVLKSVFGFDQFRPGQQQVIDRLLAGHSTVAIFPTGGGKSLCYQIPALLLDGITVVISPLIALMKDQIDMLKRCGVAAARLDSSLDQAQTRAVYTAIERGTLKLLYIAPERLANERFLSRLRQLPVSLLAVDEAHCISEWGHNFRPDYLKIAGLARELKIPRVLGLTATATPSVAAGIVKAFDMDEAAVVHTGFYRPNLTLYVSPVPEKDRDALLLQRLVSRPAGPTIVYVTLQKTAEHVAEFLSQNGRIARAYHAGLESEVRTEVQDWFMAQPNSIVVATIAFGMGIDKSDIRYVYHYNLPKSLENYAQEIGRAGRDGQPSMCEVLACNSDVVVLQNFTFGDTPDADAIHTLVTAVLGQGREFDISVYELSGQADIRPLVVDTVMTYLELDGYLQSTSPFYSEYKLQLKRSLQAILAGFNASRQEFLQKLFEQAQEGRTWWKLDATHAAQALGEPRARVVSALNYLEEQQDVVLQVSGVRHGYRLLRPVENVEALCQSLVERFAGRESADLKRIDSVTGLMLGEGCYTGRLWRYFGEQRPDHCGHCGWCEGVRPTVLPAPPERPCLIPPLPESPALTAPRQKTRFLCGLSSPMTSRARLMRHPLFGRLSEVPFQKVLEAVRTSDQGEI